MAQNKKKRASFPKDVTDSTVIVDTEETTKASIPVSIFDDFSEWLQTTEAADDDFYCTVYQVKGNSTKNRVYLEKYDGCIPEPDEIGNKYGTGKFKLYMKFYNHPKLVKSYTINLHPRFGSGNWQNPNTQNQLPQAQTQPNLQQLQPAQDPMQMMATMSGIFTSMMGAMAQLQGNQNNQQSPFDVTNMMDGIMNTMGKVIQRSASDQLQLVNDITRERANLPEVVETAEETSFINQILPVIQSLLPSFLGKPKQEIKPTIDMIKGLPQYQTLMKNNRLLVSLVGHLRETQGEDKTAEIIQTLQLDKKVKEASTKINQQQTATPQQTEQPQQPVVSPENNNNTGTENK